MPKKTDRIHRTLIWRRFNLIFSVTYMYMYTVHSYTTTLHMNVFSILTIILIMSPQRTTHHHIDERYFGNMNYYYVRPVLSDLKTSSEFVLQSYMQE